MWNYIKENDPTTTSVISAHITTHKKNIENGRYAQIPVVWDLQMKNLKYKLVCKSPTKKIVCGTKNYREE